MLNFTEQRFSLLLPVSGARPSLWFIFYILLKSLTVWLKHYPQFFQIIDRVKMNMFIFMDFVSSVLSLNYGPRSQISEPKSFVRLLNT